MADEHIETDQPLVVVTIIYDKRTNTFGHNVNAGAPVAGVVNHLELVKSLLIDNQKMQMAQALAQQQATKIQLPKGGIIR